MQAGRRRHGLAVAAVAGLLSMLAQGAFSNDFEADLARVDQALKENRGRVTAQALNSCLRQRNVAARLYQRNQTARAERSLKYCFQVLRISERSEPRAAPAGPSMAEIQERAGREVEQALALPPDLENGLQIYRGCASCHGPEGWGFSNGLVPQVAGQHRKVVIKQLADIRAGNRETVVMAPYATVEVIGGVQAVADVAGYIDTLEMTTTGGKGPGDELELGERLYRESCAGCHGADGEGDADAVAPRIQAQHYNYLVRQFEWIRDGKRHNANPEMVAQIRGFEDREIHAVLDYVSRLEPPEDLQAPPGWHNPDFADSPARPVVR